ncbi:MAG: terminase small subunit [Pseudomonadales bacterium]
MSGGKLTPNQRLFVEYYLVRPNATWAAKQAYPRLKDASARARGALLLANVSVSEAIKAGQARVIEKFHVDQDMVVAGLAAIAFTNLDDVSPWTEAGSILVPSQDLSWRVKASVKGLKVTRRREVEKREDEEAWEVERVEWVMHDKVAALKLLGQHVGMRFGGPKVTAEPGSHVSVDARTQFLGITKKLDALTPEELLEAALRMPAEPGE